MGETVCLGRCLVFDADDWGGLERVFSCWVGMSLGGESLAKMCLMKGVYVEGCEGIFYLFILGNYVRRERL